MRQGPLAGRYPAVAAMVTLALIPYLALSAAFDPLVPIITEQLHMSEQAMSLSSGLGNAAYAVGTVLAVQFAQHLPQRRMLLGYAVVLVVGSVLAAAAQNPGMFIGGHVLQGLATSMLLIAAAPPLTIGFPKEKLRNTAVIMNMCVFGAVALGPFIGGVQAEAHAWRPLFWIVAAIAVLALVMAALTFDDAPPADLDAPRDLRAIGLAAVGCGAGFVGASQLTSHGFTRRGGDGADVRWPGADRGADRLPVPGTPATADVRTMLTSSIPVAGVGVALFAAAASVAATALTANVLLQTYSPVQVGLLYLPELGGAIVMAFVFGVVISRRAMHYLPLVGMVLLAAGIMVFRLALPANQPLVLLGAGLTGLALGATVAPALFVAGFSLQSTSLQRVFAIIELLRAVAAFMVAPIFAHFALTVSPDLGVGTRLRALGRFRPRDRRCRVRCGRLRAEWSTTTDARTSTSSSTATAPAWYSPPLLARLRSSAAGPGSSPEQVPEVGPRLRYRPRTRPGRCSSPTTAPNSPRSRSSRPPPAAAADSRAGGLRLAARRRGIHSGRRRHTSTPTGPPRCVRPPSGPPPMARRWPTQAGFLACSMAVEAAPTWKGIVATADEHDASLIVLGPHRRNGLLGHLQGSVASAVVAHTATPVLIVPQPAISH